MPLGHHPLDQNHDVHSPETNLGKLSLLEDTAKPSNDNCAHDLACINGLIHGLNILMRDL